MSDHLTGSTCIELVRVVLRGPIYDAFVAALPELASGG
jgi:hypothetical protein